MSAAVHSLLVYEDLAEWYDRQGQAKLRDWFLVLAADTALSLGEKDRAERFRNRLLHVNPHHMLRPFASYADALKAQDVKRYVSDLRRRYPLETAEHLLKVSQKQRAQATGPKEPEIRVLQTKKQGAVPPSSDTAIPPKTAIPKKPESKREVAVPKFQLALTWRRPRREKWKTLTSKTVKDESHPDQEEEAEKDSLSVWTSTVLIVVIVLVGLAVALYTLVSPILSN